MRAAKHCALICLIVSSVAVCEWEYPDDVSSVVKTFHDAFAASQIPGQPSVASRKVKIEFIESLPGREIGECETKNGNKTVRLNRAKWNTLSETSREVLVLHELGHCILLRGHRNAWISGTSSNQMHPASIMGENLMDDKTYLARREYYLNELIVYDAR